MPSELEMAWEYAYSFSGKTQPNGARYIGMITKGDREYLFYKDTSNKYWYESRNKRTKN